MQSENEGQGCFAFVCGVACALFWVGVVLIMRWML